MVYLICLPNGTYFSFISDYVFHKKKRIMLTTGPSILTCLLQKKAFVKQISVLINPHVGLKKKAEMKWIPEVAYKQSVFCLQKDKFYLDKTSMPFRQLTSKWNSNHKTGRGAQPAYALSMIKLDLVIFMAGIKTMSTRHTRYSMLFTCLLFNKCINL